MTPTKSSLSPLPHLTVLSCLFENDQILFVGCTDGSIEIYNFQANESKMIKTNSSTSIKNIWRGKGNEILIISQDFQLFSLQNWDLKHLLSINDNITTCSTHPLLPNLLSYGSSSDHSIRISEFDGSTGSELIPLQVIKYHEGFLGQRLGYINLVTWHPYKLILAAVSSDAFIKVYK